MAQSAPLRCNCPTEKYLEYVELNHCGHVSLPHTRKKGIRYCKTSRFKFIRVQPIEFSKTAMILKNKKPKINFKRMKNGRTNDIEFVCKKLAQAHQFSTVILEMNNAIKMDIISK